MLAAERLFTSLLHQSPVLMRNFIMAKTNKVSTTSQPETITFKDYEMSENTTDNKKALASSTNSVPPVASKTSGFDINKAKVPDSFKDNTIGPAQQLVVKAKKPSKSMYVRVHPDPEFTVSEIVMIKLKEGMDDTFFLIMPDPGSEDLAEELLSVSEAGVFQLFYYITRSMQVGVWPIQLAGADGKMNVWHESALAAIPFLQKQWGRLRAEDGQYNLIPALNTPLEPRWPAWTWQEVLEKVFTEDKIIRDRSHPVIKQLTGEAI